MGSRDELGQDSWSHTFFISEWTKRWRSGSYSSDDDVDSQRYTFISSTSAWFDEFVSTPATFAVSTSRSQSFTIDLTNANADDTDVSSGSALAWPPPSAPAVTTMSFATPSPSPRPSPARPSRFDDALTYIDMIFSSTHTVRCIPGTVTSSPCSSSARFCSPSGAPPRSGDGAGEIHDRWPEMSSRRCSITSLAKSGASPSRDPSTPTGSLA